MKKSIRAFAAPITQGVIECETFNWSAWNKVRETTVQNGRNTKKYHFFLDAHTHQTEPTFSLSYSVLGCL